MNIESIKAENAVNGFYFFEPALLRFFDGRVSSQTFGRYFVTSERFRGLHSDDGPRLMDGGSVATIGEFQQHATLHEALRVARVLAE